MNYEEMSDFEINQLVAINLGIEIPVIDGIFNIIEGNIAVKTDPNGGLNRQRIFGDYCNNPSDAWPIIVKNAIALLPNTEYLLNRKLRKFKMNYMGSYVASVFPTMSDGFSGDEIAVLDQNPLRAAMICFLKMKESQS